MSEERKDRAETRGGSGMDLTLRPIPSPQSDPLFDAVIGFLGETGNEIRDEPIRPNPLREPSGGDGIPVVPPVTPPQYPKRWLVVSWFSAALTLSGMWMFDEILTLARYCGLLCPYNIPLVGEIGQYDAEAISWLMILLGIIVLMVAWSRKPR